MNVTFGLIEDTSHSPIRDKARRRQMMVDRALAAIREWRDAVEAPAGVAALIPYSEIEAARRRLAGVAHRTPVLTSRQFDEACGASVFFKAESFQRAGAFKFRGAYNKVKAELERRAFTEVVAYSSGNHAQAVALVSKLLGLKATLVMPKDAPAAKLAATRGYGAEIVLYDRYTEKRDEIGERLQRERGALLVPPFDDPLVMAGQGTAAAELLEMVPDLDVLLVPVSGGGLIGGCASAARHLRPSIDDLRRRARDGRRHRAVAAQGRARRDPRAQDDRRRPPGALPRAS